MRRLVLDCSIALAWSVASQATPLSHKAQIEVQAHGAVVPFIFPIAVANALWKLERRKLLSAAQLDVALQGFELIDLEIDVATLDIAAAATLPLARHYTLSLYDAAYLELALRQKIPLATRDKQLAAATTAAGGILFAP